MSDQPNAHRTQVLQFGVDLARQPDTAVLTIIALRADGTVAVQTDGDAATLCLSVEQAKAAVLANLVREA